MFENNLCHKQCVVNKKQNTPAEFAEVLPIIFSVLVLRLTFINILSDQKLIRYYFGKGENKVHVLPA